MWTERSYDALYRWAEGKQEEARAALLADGLTEIVERLESAPNLGVWYRITREAAKAVGTEAVQRSAIEAEAELSAMAATLGRKGGQARSPRKTAACRVNGPKGGRPRSKPPE